MDDGLFQGPQRYLGREQDRPQGAEEETGLLSSLRAFDTLVLNVHEQVNPMQFFRTSSDAENFDVRIDVASAECSA